MSFQAPSRRSVVKAGIWTAPAVVAVSAAPAFAASLCKPSIPFAVNWASTTSPYAFVPFDSANQFGPGTGTIIAAPDTSGLSTAEVNAIQPLTVTASNTFPNPTTGVNRMAGGSFTYSGNTFSNMRVTTVNVSNWQQRGLTLAQSQGQGSTTGTTRYDHRQQLTLGFDRPVSSLSFRIGDIDATSRNHSDRVNLTSTPDVVHTTSAKASTLYGDGRGTTDGTTTGPYRPTGSAIVDDNTGTGGNVTVTYPSPVTAVTIRFWNNDSDGGMQWIFLSNLTFNASTCK